ncbi:hypothetical protein tb265_23980 [Gemmatimonadetes bacterium T265]|nr:hypothetical protein tb265_23980 [Gemmatimonadetes bacterium T265]
MRTPTNEAVADAELTVLGDHGAGAAGDGRSVRTRPGGTFRIDSIPPGRYFVRVRRLGFEPLYFSATLDGGAARRIDVELKVLPAQLGEVNVRGASGYSGFAERRLRDFESRRRVGFGRFYTRDDLKAFDGRFLSDAFPYLALGVTHHGVDAFSPFPTWVGYGGCALYRGYSGARYGGLGYARGTWGGPGAGLGCDVGVSIDGAPPIPGDVAADYPVSQIEALEVYNRIVVVWTGAETND